MAPKAMTARTMFQLPRLKLSPGLAAAPRLPPGKRVYAIGDVHGCYDLLVALLQKIDQDNAQRPEAEVYLVLLGDLINRGPASYQVMSLVADLKVGGSQFVALRGNHEATLLAAWHGSAAACRQLHRMGVKQTLASYGVDITDYDLWDIDQLATLIQQSISPQHIALIEQMPLLWSCGDFVFVHASLEPGRSLEEQSEATLLWSRQAYQPGKSDPTAVVHGHANLIEPANERYRVCVDTSAHRTSVLTAVGLEGQERWFLATEPA
jgi:serine/threonine protein phosphatase 1